MSSESKRPGVMIHPSACVDEPCEIGRGTRIWHFCHVLEGARIGEQCSLGQGVMVASDVTLGNNVKVQNNVSIFTGVTLEDDVFCGPSMVFTNVINPRSEIPRRDEYRETIVRRGATLGANATIVCGVEIGRFAFVAAGAVVTHDVPDYALVVGVPGRAVGWACRCGWKLPTAVASGDLSCKECGNEYRESAGRLEPVREVQGSEVKT